MAERLFSCAPRLGHAVQWFTGSAIMVGGMNTVTGATASVGLLEGYNETTGYVGEYFRLSFASTEYTVGSYRLGGAAPPGLTLSPEVNEYGVGTIDGTPLQAGVYNVDIYAYKNENQTGDSTLLAITVYILEPGPDIEDHPASANLPWGSSHRLEVVIGQAEGASFQWRKNGEDIPGATGPAYQIAQATSSDTGVYEVVITQDDVSLTSEAASVTVQSSGYHVWKETAFPDPFNDLTGGTEDPDWDGLINLVEFAVGTNPLEPTAIQLPAVSREHSVLGDYVVYSYRRNSLSSGVTVSAEYTDQLNSPDWRPIVNYANGMMVEQTETAFIVKVPSEAACFVRFRISES